MALLLFVIVSGFYWKLTLTKQYDWIWGFDLANQVLPWYQVEARAFHAKSFPLWDPYLWGGQPLLAQTQPGAAYPLNWILFALPLRRGHIMWDALQLYFVVIRLMAAGFCYLLCRDLGRTRAASLAAGIVFTFSGFMAETGWPQMASGAVWIPLVFLFLLRGARSANRWGNAALSGMFLGGAFLSGHHQVPTFAALAVAGTWLYFIFRGGKPDWRFAKAAVVAFLFTGLTGALQILPAYEYGHLAKRWVGVPEPVTWDQPVPYTVHETFDLKGVNLIGIVFPSLHAHFDAFIGVVALALALLAVAACWKDARIRLIGAVGLGGLIYALGSHSIFQGFLYAVVPSLEKARAPSAAVALFQFGAAVLTAFGLDHLRGPDPSPWPRRIMWGVLMLGLFTAAVVQVMVFTKRPPSNEHVVTALIALLFAALLFAWSRGNLSERAAVVLLILLLLFEYGNNPDTAITPRSETERMRQLEELRANEDVAAFLKQQPGYYRANVADAFAGNWGEWHGVPMWEGGLASVTLNQINYEFFTFQAHMLHGVAYTIAKAPAPQSGDEVFSGASGMKVYKQAAVFPRAWSVHELRELPNPRAGVELIHDHLSDFHNMAFLFQQPPDLETCGPQDDVAIEDFRPQFVRIRARMACTGAVVLSDTFYPGWRADVDGRPAAIYEVNGAMRAVVVPQGDHVLTMRFLPTSVIVGALLSMLGVVGAIVLARRKGPQSELRP